MVSEANPPEKTNWSASPDREVERAAVPAPDRIWAALSSVTEADFGDPSRIDIVIPAIVGADREAAAELGWRLGAGGQTNFTNVPP